MHLNFADAFKPSGLASLGQIILGDLTMAGDNVVVIGSVAGGLPERERRRVLMLGVAIALVFLIGFSLIAVELMRVPGLVLAGGVMLLWVAGHMWRDLRHDGAAADDAGSAQARRLPKTFLAAAIQVTIADLSMSLDNVLLVASIARENPALLVIGLSFSVLVMGLAANLVAGLIGRYPWIGYVGLAVILWVAVRMIFDGIADPVVGVRHLFA
jgi:YjbE family integral membrane protein